MSLLNLVIFCLSLLLSKLGSRVYFLNILFTKQKVQWIFSDRYPMNSHKNRNNRKNTTESKKKNDPIIDFRAFHKLYTPYAIADTMICMRVVTSLHQSQEMRQIPLLLVLAKQDCLIYRHHILHNNHLSNSHHALYLDQEILLIQIYLSLPCR